MEINTIECVRSVFLFQFGGRGKLKLDNSFTTAKAQKTELFVVSYLGWIIELQQMFCTLEIGEIEFIFASG